MIDQIPNVDFKIRENGEWVTKNSEELFIGKTVMFALPGAFTPTCSSTHLPKYDLLYDEFKAAGVKEVYCLSVNDSFVMNACVLY